jgi:hypothetical protein
MGFSSITLLFVLSLSASALIYSYKNFIKYQNTYINRSVVKYVDSSMLVLKNYYKTECYTNNGIVAASLSLNDLRDAGYIQTNYPTPQKGTIAFLIDDSFTFAQLSIQITFNSTDEAQEIYNVNGNFSSVLSGRTVTWKATTTSISSGLISSDVDMQLYGNGDCY